MHALHLSKDLITPESRICSQHFRDGNPRTIPSIHIGEKFASAPSSETARGKKRVTREAIRMQKACGPSTSTPLSTPRSISPPMTTPRHPPMTTPPSTLAHCVLLRYILLHHLLLSYQRNLVSGVKVAAFPLFLLILSKLHLIPLLATCKLLLILL